ncbi:hypothetical protein SDC9_102078 [bioreactor metagenome]|uniref:Phage protein n=1 Tax=bioreactor metagenome TaxID=1076179 RepID=A0A645B0K0_9ZZZZ
MLLTIADKEVEVLFGTRFVRELDKRYTINLNGAEFGFGLNKASFYMSQRSPVGLADLIECGTRTAKRFKPTTEQIEAFIDEQEDLEELFATINEELLESNVTKKQWAEIAAEMGPQKS